MSHVEAQGRSSRSREPQAKEDAAVFVGKPIEAGLGQHSAASSSADIIHMTTTWCPMAPSAPPGIRGQPDRERASRQSPGAVPFALSNRHTTWNLHVVSGVEVKARNMQSSCEDEHDRP